MVSISQIAGLMSKLYFHESNPREHIKDFWELNKGKDHSPGRDLASNANTFDNEIHIEKKSHKKTGWNLWPESNLA